MKKDGIQWGQLKHVSFRSKSGNLGWEAARSVHFSLEKKLGFIMDREWA